MSIPNIILRFLFLFFISGYLSLATSQAQPNMSRDTAAILAFNDGKALMFSDGFFIITDALTHKKIRIAAPQPGALYYSTISEDGRWFIYSTKTKAKRATYIHDLAKNGELRQLFPFALESATITADGKSTFFIHSKTFWKAKLAAYNTKDWQLQAERAVANPTNSVAVNADGSQLLVAAGAVITAIHPKTLKTEKINWEKSRLTNLTYNPIIRHQYASINHKNTIEVRDLLEDRVLHTIRANGGQITRIAYTPTGTGLVSLDNTGNLVIWNLDDRSVQMRDREVRAHSRFDGHHLTVLKDAWQRTDYEPTDRPAQPDSAFLGKTKKVDMLPTPLVAYTPEASFLLGFGMSFVFHSQNDSTTAKQRYFRPSIITTSAAYGFSGQFQTSLIANHFGKRGWHFVNQISYISNNRSYFFGLGHGAERKINTVYHNDVFSWTGTLTKGFGDRFFAGIAYQIRHDSPLKNDGSTSLSIPDADGGFLTGTGPVLRFDTRNDLLFTTKGYYVDLSVMRFGNWLGSDYQFSDVRLDYRGFHALPILTTGTTLAVQALYQGTFSGDAPFYQLPYLSADRILRGVWRNLYIDRQALAVQAELRSNFSNIDPRYGYVLFAGAGDVAPDFFKGYTPDIIGVFGVGYRQQVIPKLKLQSRIDFSYTTKGNFGVFGGLGLSF